MAASWETLRLAVEMGDFSMATGVLREELGYTSKRHLLHFIRGVLADIVREDEEGSVKHDAAIAPPPDKPKPASQPRRGGSAFSRRLDSSVGATGGAAEDAGEADDSATQSNPVPQSLRDQVSAFAKADRQWRRTLRAMFSPEAAAAMMTDLLVFFKRDDFGRDAKQLSDSWGPGVSHARRQAAVDELCLRCAHVHVFPRYGFAGDASGQGEFRIAIDEMAAANSLVRDLQREIQKILAALVPSLGVPPSPPTLPLAPAAGPTVPKEISWADEDGDVSTMVLVDGRLMWRVADLGEKLVEKLTISQRVSEGVLGAQFTVDGPFDEATIADPSPGPAQIELMQKMLSMADAAAVSTVGDAVAKLRVSSSRD